MPKILGACFDHWEREVRRQLEAQLPPDWIVVCNISWTLPTDSGVMRDGQCDFVVLVPGLGMAIVEVKGSQYVRVGEDGLWYRRTIDRKTREAGPEVRIDEPPPDQACRNMHTLAKAVARQLGKQVLPGAYAYLVSYPNGVIEAQAPLFDPSTIIAQQDMPHLARRIRGALVARAGASQVNGFDEELARKVASILSNNQFRVGVRDSPLDANEDAREIDELTRLQFFALRGAFDLPRVAVVGPAGSGKTLLALWKLEALIEQGTRALYVCFNKALAEHLCNRHPEMAQAITSVDRLFRQWANVPPGGQYDDRFFRETLPSRVQDVANDKPSSSKYEAIIVDEGQDFGELRLLALLDLLVPDGQWLLLADWEQNLYHTDTQQQIGADVTFSLRHNCRNTQLVNTATNGYCQLSVPSMPSTPLGVAPKVVKCNAASMATRAWAVAHELSPEGGVVFLSPYRLENSCLASTPRGHGLQLTEDLSLLEQKGYVFFSTIKSFKGLEARDVVLLHADLPGRSPALTPEDLYVACTRATGRLAVVTSSDEAVAWFTRELTHSSRPDE